MALPDSRSDSHGQPRAFATTLWSVIVSARDAAAPGSDRALETLCRTYWFPLYAYVRRQGYEPADAQDLAQGFFTRLLEKKQSYLGTVGPEKGRFRFFLLAALRHFLADERDHAQALKRGGRSPHLSIQADEAELIFARELAIQETPEKLYERRWAMAVLDCAQARLRDECVAADKAELYAAVGPNQSADGRSETYLQTAARLGLTETALKSAALRLRRRYQELIREEVAQTLSNPAELEEEMRYLLRVLSG